MSFIGAPVLQKVTDNCFRLTGVSLLPGTSGTIGFTDKTVPAEVSISAPEWQPYELDGIVSLQDSVKVDIEAASSVGTAVPVFITKTGTTHQDFLITIQNAMIPDGGLTTPSLEIYIELAGH